LRTRLERASACTTPGRSSHHAHDVAENRNRDALNRMLTRHRLGYEDENIPRSREGSERSI
jgi:hypothetical protein